MKDIEDEKSVVFLAIKLIVIIIIIIFKQARCTSS